MKSSSRIFNLVGVPYNMQKNFSIEILLTHACNFRCKYCYEKDTPYEKSISPLVVERFPQFVRDIQKEYNSTEIAINYFGGEPSLKSDVIKQLGHALNDEPWCQFHIVTNGYNIEDLKQHLIDTRYKYGPNKFFVQVSYDYGPNQLNRREAKTLDGEASRKKVLETIYWLVQNDIRFSVKPTMTTEGLVNIEQVYFDYRDLLDRIHITHPEINFSLKETLDTYDASPITEEILSKFRQGMSNIVAYQLKHGITDDFNWLVPDKAMCSVASNIVSVDIDGSLYPCHGAAFTKNKHVHRYKDTIFAYDCSRLFRNDIFGDAPDSECSKCFANTCLRCNIHAFDRSNKDNYDDKMRDYACGNETACTVYREASKFVLAKYKMLNDRSS